MFSAAAISQPAPGWLRSRHFDLTLIRSVTLLALLSGLIVVLRPELFGLVLLTDLWLLGYHHVVSTLTRLSFDRASARKHRFLLVYLPPLVFAATFLLAWQVGVWLIATIYLYWQWFHYTRQSWGVQQAYRRKAGELVDDDPRFALLTFYLLPVYGILYRSWQAPDTFLFQEVRVLPVPGLVVDVVGIAAGLCITAWAVRRVLAWRRGRLARAHTAFVAAHFTVFFVSYRMIDDITVGWLVINIWHNAQYILFVWLFNTNRFRGGVDPSARFLSWLSQSENKYRYVAVCLGISTVTYGVIHLATGSSLIAGLPFLVLVYQTINFHHYIVDAMIWRMRRRAPAVQPGPERG
jgi:hypothetical protein